MGTASSEGAKRITFRFNGAAGQQVYVAGTFNQWDPKKNRLTERAKAGLYSATVRVPKGRHEYKFSVNGEWHIDPACPAWAPNEFGSLNSVLVVE